MEQVYNAIKNHKYSQFRGFTSPRIRSSTELKKFLTFMSTTNDYPNFPIFMNNKKFQKMLRETLPDIDRFNPNIAGSLSI